MKECMPQSESKVHRDDGCVSQVCCQLIALQKSALKTRVFLSPTAEYYERYTMSKEYYDWRQSAGLLLAATAAAATAAAARCSVTKTQTTGFK